MIIGINEKKQIKQVREITDETLLAINLDETSESYPFKGWADEKILCYCYDDNGKSVSVYPYIDINIIEKIDDMAMRNLINRADIDYVAIMTEVDL